MNKIAKILKEEILNKLSTERFRHSLRVAKLAKKIALKSNFDIDKTLIASLAHDLCKEFDLSEQKKLADLLIYKDFICDNKISYAIHGPAAAAYIYLNFSINDFEILEAISYHTLGKKNMGKLASIIYCADKLEPKRKRITKSFRIECLRLNTYEMYRAVKKFYENKYVEK